MSLFSLRLWFAGNQKFVNDTFGEDSAVAKMFAKMAKNNDYKDKAEFVLPFGPRRQNILLLGVDASNNDEDLWTGTRTDTIILVNIDPRSKSVNAISIPRVKFICLITMVFKRLMPPTL